MHATFIIFMISYFFGIRDYQYTAGYRILGNELTVFKMIVSTNVFLGVGILGTWLCTWVAIQYIKIGTYLWSFPSFIMETTNNPRANIAVLILISTPKMLC